MDLDQPIDRRAFVARLGIAAGALLSASCATEDVQRRAEERDAFFRQVETNMQTRRDIRDERMRRSRRKLLGLY